MTSTNNFKNKNVLLFGLGLLGGGVATANWLLKQGAKLTIADAKSEKELASSLEKIKGIFEFKREPTLDGIDSVVLNPGVSFRHPLVLKAREFGIAVLN